MKKILLATPDKEVLRLLKFKLSREEYHVLSANTGERALDLFQGEKPDMVVVDSSLPKPDGYEICRHIRRHPRQSHAFIILLVARGERTRFRQGLEWGADDYILKPVNLQEMTRRIKALMLRNSRENGQSPLTGLPGQELVEREIKRRIDWEEKFALGALNLVHFRAYNEVYGFEFGDRAIRQLCRILTKVKEELKPKDFFLGHMGADRFIIMLKPDQVERYCQEVIRGFEQIRPELFPRSDLERGYIVAADKTGRMRRFSLMAISIGVITPELRSFQNVQEALDAARWAVHKAKSRWGSNYYLRKDGSMGLVDARNNGGSKKILMANDDPLSLRPLKAKLERAGYLVRTASTGREALEVVKKDPPDLIFLDETLSEVDDCHTASCIKRDARTAAIPVVMLTVSAERYQEWVVGADDYLVKPYSFKYLMRKVEKYLAHT